jgi:hypothetical protein
VRTIRDVHYSFTLWDLKIIKKENPNGKCEFSNVFADVPEKL